jgi:hypothetical protein
MPYITREDGEHFVIPSYRDVLSAKQKSALKKEILLLSQNYGEYVALQKKGTTQYEVAFSPDAGYLLGESIWHHFKRPLDMIYCEALPNATEAILVIVKAGSVYLDGSFPIESIPDELVIFLTQQNNFEIFTYGEVPISQTPEEGKFSFDPNSVKSYAVLDKPVYPTLPLLKIYQLRLVDTVLKEQNIGVFPTKQIIMGVILLALLWMMYALLSSLRKAPPPAVVQVNPYAGYNSTLASPAPNEELDHVLNTITGTLLSIPGWQPTQINYARGSMTAQVQSSGTKTQVLLDWALKNKATINIQTNGMYVVLSVPLEKRAVPTKIYQIKEVIAQIVDRLSDVYPGNHLKLGAFANKGVYTEVPLTISINNVSPALFDLIVKQFKGLPMVLQSATFNVSNGSLTGTIIINALGS